MARVVFVGSVGPEAASGCGGASLLPGPLDGGREGGIRDAA